MNQLNIIIALLLLVLWAMFGYISKHETSISEKVASFMIGIVFGSIAAYILMNEFVRYLYS